MYLDDIYEGLFSPKSSVILLVWAFGLSSTRFLSFALENIENLYQ
jgi:hypothetical protein